HNDKRRSLARVVFFLLFGVLKSQQKSARMYCSQCATELSPDDVYCPACSKPVASFTIDIAQVPQVEPLDRAQVTIVRRVAVQRTNKPFWLGALVGATAMLSVVLLAVVVSSLLTSSRNTAQVTTNAATPKTST